MCARRGKTDVDFFFPTHRTVPIQAHSERAWELSLLGV